MILYRSTLLVLFLTITLCLGSQEIANVKGKDLQDAPLSLNKEESSSRHLRRRVEEDTVEVYYDDAYYEGDDKDLEGDDTLYESEDDEYYEGDDADGDDEYYEADDGAYYEGEEAETLVLDYENGIDPDVGEDYYDDAVDLFEDDDASN